MTYVPAHPAEFSPEVIAELAKLISAGERVYDPYGGRGLRLGALCDRLGATFTATDIEEYRDADPRVAVGNAEDVETYPALPFTVVTSPTYVNKRLSDYAKVGPKPTTQQRGRRDYAISLGRALHPENTARLTGRHAARNGGAAYYAAHAGRSSTGAIVPSSTSMSQSPHDGASCSSSTGTRSPSRSPPARAATAGSTTPTSGPTTRSSSSPTREMLLRSRDARFPSADSSGLTASVRRAPIPRSSCSTSTDTSSPAVLEHRAGCLRRRSSPSSPTLAGVSSQARRQASCTRRSTRPRR
jgi:hypothetical protein